MIYDEYTYKPVSRQRRYQLRMRALGRCVACGGPSGGPRHCTECGAKKRIREKGRRRHATEKERM